jgi:alkylation response protein AidB-like acyl-CoA dehydrogenase
LNFIGASEDGLGATNEFLKPRKQFGQPIGRFQVLQHRMVAMYMALEESRSLTFLATLTLGTSAIERRRAVACAKSEIGDAGEFIGGQAVQLHGGMAMTDELNVSHYFNPYDL